MTAPPRTVDQRMAALALANEIRIRRAKLKRRLATGEVLARDIILDPPAYADSMKALEIVLATPKVGPVKASNLLHRARVSPSKSLGGLTERQRFDLVGELPYAAHVRSARS